MLSIPRSLLSKGRVLPDRPLTCTSFPQCMAVTRFSCAYSRRNGRLLLMAACCASLMGLCGGGVLLWLQECSMGPVNAKRPLLRMISAAYGLLINGCSPVHQVWNERRLRPTPGMAEARHGERRAWRRPGMANARHGGGRARRTPGKAGARDGPALPCPGP